MASLDEALKTEQPAESSKRIFMEKVLGSYEKSESCRKAKSMIARYSFTEIEAKSCKGKVYHFWGIRDGRKFSIKIVPRTGELIEVKTLLESSGQGQSSENQDDEVSLE
jgi:hypothetical protein